ncbi:hypothetical protein [Enterobacter sp. KB-221C9]|uniref:hypothetical protein n=1 Tax=Enterobacter sp. KB-221C9 TaxID=3242496 RepID=UPI003522D42D
MFRGLIFVFCMLYAFAGMAQDKLLSANLTPQQFIKAYNKDISTLGKKFRSARIINSEGSKDGKMIQFHISPQIAGLGWVSESGKLTSVMWLIGGKGLNAADALASICSMMDSLDDSLILKDTGPLVTSYINNELDSTPVEFNTEDNKYQISRSDEYGIMIQVSPL